MNPKSKRSRARARRAELAQIATNEKILRGPELAANAVWGQMSKQSMDHAMKELVRQALDNSFVAHFIGVVHPRQELSIKELQDEVEKASRVGVASNAGGSQTRLYKRRVAKRHPSARHKSRR